MKSDDKLMKSDITSCLESGENGILQQYVQNFKTKWPETIKVDHKNRHPNDKVSRKMKGVSESSHGI